MSFNLAASDKNPTNTKQVIKNKFLTADSS
jgi:hypothetical protein